MKKAPKKPAGPVRGILRAPKKGKPGRAAAVQPPPRGLVAAAAASTDGTGEQSALEICREPASAAVA
ncbi:hypothetical protein PG985_012173 [Apiospora marii]|uniref:Uncharacterized protein n=1 Tax=Apiospora marii TaxID=335849 RepID=A0ABR1RE01_9PEZI